MRRAIEQSIEELSERFALSHQRRQQIFYTLELFQRLCEEIPENEKTLRMIVRKPSFNDAIDLFSLLVDATGEGQAVLDAWRRIAVKHRRHSGPGDESVVRPPRRRRPRRRRR